MKIVEKIKQLIEKKKVTTSDITFDLIVEELDKYKEELQEIKLKS